MGNLKDGAEACMKSAPIPSTAPASPEPNGNESASAPAAAEPAHSKSEYKRRVALGDPGVLPPVSAPEPDGEAKPVAWIEWNDAKNEASLGAEPTRDKETYELLPGFSFRPLYAASASQRDLLRECRDALWVCSEHNALHHGEARNTVIQARATLAKLREHLKDDKAVDAGVAASSDARDAARYRWLRDQWDRIGVLDGVMLSKSSDGTSWVGSQVLDKRIDEAMANHSGVAIPQTNKEN